MQTIGYTELTELRKELHFAGIPVLSDEVDYDFSDELGEYVKNNLQRKDADWDGDILTLSSAEPFPDQLFITKQVPVKVIWIQTPHGHFAFNPNLKPKLYFRDGYEDNHAEDEALKVDEIMRHYLYTRVKDYEALIKPLEQPLLRI